MALKAQTGKEKLVEAAIDLFYKHGVHWVSFQQIAAKVGVSQPALYKHFKDKDDLLAACVIQSAQRGRALIDSHVLGERSAPEKLRAYFEGNFLWIEKHPREAAAFLAMFYFAYNSAEIAVVMKDVHSQSVQRISSHLLSGNYEKAWSVPDPRETARIVHDLLLGEMLKAIHHPKEFKLSARVDLVWAPVQKILNCA